MGASAIASLIISAISAIYGGVKSSQANKAYDKKISDNKKDLQGWYDKEANTNILDTEQGRSAIELIRRQLERSNKNIDSQGAVTGSSSERTVAAKSKGQETMADAITRMLGYGTARKDRLDSRYQYYMNNLDRFDLQNVMNKGQNWANFGSNTGNVFSSALMGEGTGDDWFSNLFKEKITPKGIGYANQFISNPGLYKVKA